MNRFLNDPDTFVKESLEGLAAAHGKVLRVHQDPLYVHRVDSPVSGKVGILSGGGSGHEPLHAGFVGRGMLDAACPGEIFTSPTPDQIVEAAKAIDGGNGILFIVKNYSGDIMNFEMAADLVRAEGLRVQTVVVDDDVAVKDSTYTQGRRGTGTTVAIEKICGSAAEAGYDLPNIGALGRRVNLHGRSIGLALSSCSPPATGRPMFALSEKEVEFGIGIHGEPGVERVSAVSSDEMVSRLVESLLADQDYTRKSHAWDDGSESRVEVEETDQAIGEGDRVLALVSGMGATPLAELYIVYRALAEHCVGAGIRIERNLVGNLVTSLDMRGVLITLVKLDEEMLGLWDAPVRTAALQWG
ncbi:PTS-dependent dihydroxyacetone kinase, dihydroxyacetone-binding subunit DhaK [Planctomycetes bacterium Pan216]|uniref:PTS-dependent dihydroxyacetone kinase, dihydroxyacetone-binding subunit DhaK n=1 Tax=Kolteria novifilia TaxID=2527975 RepID=A0A518BCD0_9BACT|nr:PTS-dependent dihydroxyacetone kinase, dihydroxyacetone-binding subunit DhaK [Planctomycetes bacterium Pan216]